MGPCVGPRRITPPRCPRGAGPRSLDRERRANAWTDPSTAGSTHPLNRGQQRGGPHVDIQLGGKHAARLQRPDARRQTLLPAAQQLDHDRPRPGSRTSDLKEQRPERALVPLRLVALDHHVPPLFPGLPRVEAAQIRLLVLQDLLRLEPGHRDEQFVLAGREVVEELALARAGPRHDVVQRRRGDAPLPQDRRRTRDDPTPRRLAFRGQLPGHAPPPCHGPNGPSGPL